MIAVETTCIRCGRTFTPTPEDIRRGLWRVCPSCRELTPWSRGNRAAMPGSADEENTPMNQGHPHECG